MAAAKPGTPESNFRTVSILTVFFHFFLTGDCFQKNAPDQDRPLVQGLELLANRVAGGQVERRPQRHDAPVGQSVGEVLRLPVSDFDGVDLRRRPNRMGQGELVLVLLRRHDEDLFRFLLQHVLVALDLEEDVEGLLEMERLARRPFLVDFETLVIFGSEGRQAE